MVSWSRSLVLISSWIVLLLLFQHSSAQTNQTGCSEIVDIIFLLDSSLSIRETCPLDVATDSTTDNWQLILNFISELVARIPVDGDKVRVGVIPFSTSVSTSDVIPLSAFHDPDSLRRQLSSLPFLGGNTNMTGALRHVRSMFSDALNATGDRGGKQVAVLLTDGMNNVDSDPVQESRLVKRDGIRLFTVGISDYVDDAELKEMATGPATYGYVFAQDFSHLNLLVGLMLDRLVCSNPPPTLPCRDSRADVAFIIDASGSIAVLGNDTNYLGNWNLMKEFVVTLIRQLNVSADDTHVALIRFSFEADVIFPLNRYYSPNDAIAIVQNLDIVKSSTNTSGALKVMRTSVFNQSNGDRRDVNNVAIVITDGQSDNRTFTEEEALAAKNSGIRMFAIGLTNQIDATELQSIASQPLSEHYFNRTTIPLVKTVTSQLLWSVCHNPCQPNDSKTCQMTDNSRNATFCPPNKQVRWQPYPGYLLLGYNYATLTDIGSLSQCQEACLQDYKCRSIEFIGFIQQCSISYVTKDYAPDSFRPDSQVDYYEPRCE